MEGKRQLRVQTRQIVLHTKFVGHFGSMVFKKNLPERFDAYETHSADAPS